MDKQQQEYADALDEVDRKVAAGEMTAGEAAVWRQKLLAESTERPRPTWAKVLIVVAVVVVAILIMRVFVAVAGLS
jgi:cytochrome c-type biogenesis protein CcmH/NrfG